ncbi:MAG: HEPN domain-containing protein [Desulfosporosinus sp.]|nr:HEPN domain-containing protein [Desulfosporosinus sp.]
MCCPYDAAIESINEWFVMAQKDLRSAKILFEYDADNEIVCFHCQQTLEKYLKGYLIAMTGELQEGHNLLKLCKRAMLHDLKFNVFLKDMAFVNVFYIETRYPAIDPLLVSKEDTEECFRIVDGVLTRINELLGSSIATKKV